MTPQGGAPHRAAHERRGATQLTRRPVAISCAPRCTLSDYGPIVTLGIVNQFSDQFLAKQLLEMREHGLTFRRFFGKNLMLHLLFAISISLMIYFGWPKYCDVCQVAHGGNWLMVGLAIGFFFGFFLVTMTTIRAISKNLPFRLKVTDWDKVQRLANGEDVA